MENYKEFQESCEKFYHNRDNMGFHAEVTVNSNGKLRIEVKECKAEYEKYIPSMRKLMLTISQMAVKTTCQIFQPLYGFTPEDQQSLENEAAAYVNSNINRYLNVLFSGNLEQFVNIVSTENLAKKVSYYLNRISFLNGNWTLPDGTVYYDGGWNKDGNMYYDAISSVLKDLIIVKEQAA